MCFDALARAGRHLLPVLLLLAGEGAGQAATAGPSKAESTRKGYDFRRPDPGEILPNPATGVGPPPRLMQFTPTADMNELGGGADDAPAPADAAPAGLHPAGGGGSTPSEAASGAPAAPASASAAAPPDPVQPRPAPRLQALFAAAVARAGIGASLSGQPGVDAAGDPAQRASDERLWARLDGSLAASRAAWERRHPDQGGAEGKAVDAVVEPGHVTLLKAPARVTGAFDDPNP